MRYPSVDILRTVAIVVMVLVHFSENLSGYYLPFAGLGAPLFTFLSGASYRLWLNGQERRQVSDEEISKISVRRGLFVFGIGFAFNIFVWLPEDTFNWDVLTFIGAALLLLNLVRRLPLSVAVLIAIMSYLISPVLRALVDFPAYWENGYFECDLTLTEVLTGFLQTGYFPFLPWITYSLTGFVAATLLFSQSQAEKPSIWPTAILGGVLIVAANAMLQLRVYAPATITTYVLTGWSMFPPSMEYMLATIGMALLLFSLSHRYVDQNQELPRDWPLFRLVKTFSRYAFTIYLIHHVVHLWPLWIYGLATGNEATHFWQQAMPTVYALPLGILFLAICYLILRRLDPDERYGMEGWMRWLCD